jgi:hypothetical protein
MIRILSYDDSGLFLTDVIKNCGTRVRPLQSLNYSNSRVRGHGQFDDHMVPLLEGF